MLSLLKVQSGLPHFPMLLQRHPGRLMPIASSLRGIWFWALFVIIEWKLDFIVQRWLMSGEKSGIQKRANGHFLMCWVVSRIDLFICQRPKAFNTGECCLMQCNLIKSNRKAYSVNIWIVFSNLNSKDNMAYFHNKWLTWEFSRRTHRVSSIGGSPNTSVEICWQNSQTGWLTIATLFFLNSQHSWFNFSKTVI